MIKVECYFPDQQSSDEIEIHGIDYLQHPEYTLCGMAWEEWDCGYDFKKRITDKPITCKKCIDVLEHSKKNYSSPYTFSMKIECFFPEYEDETNKKVHAIDNIKELTICKMDWMENGNSDTKPFMTDKEITCEDCKKIIKHNNKYQLTKDGWI